MKTDEPRQNRIPFMMSDAELDAVDEWRFKNRIGTRAEAIRRLWQIALHIDQAADRMLSLSHKVDAEHHELGNSLYRAGQAEKDEVEAALDTAVTNYETLVPDLIDLRVLARLTGEIVRSLKVGGDIEAVLANAAHWRGAADSLLRLQAKLRDDYRSKIDQIDEEAKK